MGDSYCARCGKKLFDENQVCGCTINTPVMLYGTNQPPLVTDDPFDWLKRPVEPAIQESLLKDISRKLDVLIKHLSKKKTTKKKGKK